MIKFFNRARILGRNVPDRLLSKSLVRRLVAEWLEKNGWTLRSMPAYTDNADLFAIRDSKTIAIICSGVDKPMMRTQMAVLQNSLIGSKVHPVFIYGEHRDPRLWERIREGMDIILPISELPLLNDKIDNETMPGLTGSVNRVSSHQKIRGWAKLSLSAKASIEAHYNGRVIGAAVADIFRQDLSDKGDGKFGFELSLTEPLTPMEILDFVKIQAFYQMKWVGTLRYWERAAQPSIDEPVRNLIP